MSVREISSRLKGVVSGSKFWWIIAAVFVVARTATWLFPFDSDHWIFYYVGRRWLAGDMLYLEVWDHKSPLIFGINAVMHALLGNNIVLHRLFITAIAIGTIYLFYITAIRLFEVVGRLNVVLDARIATIIFTFWASLSQFTNSGNNTENFGILVLLAAVYCYLRFVDTKLWKWLLYSGVAISFLVMLKINFSILIIPMIIDLLRRYRHKLPQLFQLVAVWVMPTVVHILLWVSYFYPRNLLGELWTASISFNGKYLRAGWAGALSGQKVFIAILAVAFMFFVGAFYMTWKQRSHEKKSTLLITIAGSALFFSLILGTFYTHYYLIVIPYFCFIAGAYWRTVARSRLWLTLAVIGAVGSLGISTKQLYNRFYGPAAADARNMANAAAYVKERTNPAERIVFYGYGATFYRLAEREAGSRYTSASHPLIDEREGFGYDFDSKYIGDMSFYQPKYIIVDQATKKIYVENKRVIQFFENHYELETVLPGYEILGRKQ